MTLCDECRKQVDFATYYHGKYLCADCYKTMKASSTTTTAH